MTTDRPLDSESSELQSELNRLADKLGVDTVSAGRLTNDGLNIFVADDGVHHYTFYERGQLGFDQTGSLDDVLYWFAEGVVSSQAAKNLGERADRFAYEYEVLGALNPDWAKRNVRDTAALFRRAGQPEDIALLPDIGEPL